MVRTLAPNSVAIRSTPAFVPGSKPAVNTPAARSSRAVADSFEAAPVAPTTGTNPADLPAAIPTGTLTYYQQRAADFVRRNPGMSPPDYYLSYGDVYVHKFSALGPNDLSPAGLAWRDRTLKNLQDAIEAKRAADPVAFAQLERDPQAFKSFCFGTHADAYLKAGLADLPPHDLLKIATTPALKDVLGPDGLKTIWQILTHFHPTWLAQVPGAAAAAVNAGGLAQA